MISKRFAYYAWTVLLFNILVILWGAFVRATGSGAGCGSHWPLCNGEIIPRAPQVQTMIEFGHRGTSGLALLLVLGLLFWAFRSSPSDHPVRLGSALSAFFIILEALIGAGLVLFEMVADNASVARAMWMTLHLANTFLLLAVLTLTAWWGSGGATMRLRGQGALMWLVGGALLGVLLLGMSGAVAALGDTLFPARSLAEGLQQDLSTTAHLLIRLRLLHPLLGLLVGVYLLITVWTTALLRPNPATRALSRLVVALFVVQLVGGLLNVLLLAPVWMQLIHLLLADALWIALVLLAASAFAVDTPQISFARLLRMPPSAA